MKRILTRKQFGLLENVKKVMSQDELIKLFYNNSEQTFKAISKLVASIPKDTLPNKVISSNKDFIDKIYDVNYILNSSDLEPARLFLVQVINIVQTLAYGEHAYNNIPLTSEKEVISIIDTDDSFVFRTIIRLYYLFKEIYAFSVYKIDVGNVNVKDIKKAEEFFKYRNRINYEWARAFLKNNIFYVVRLYNDGRSKSVQEIDTDLQSNLRNIEYRAKLLALTKLPSWSSDETILKAYKNLLANKS